MSQWSGRTKGPLIGYKIFLFSIKFFGIGFAYFILNFVSVYYFLFARKSRLGVLSFYKIALGLSSNKARKLTKRNFHIFGQTLIDRNAFLLNLTKRYSYSFINESALINVKEANKGAILLSAHLGNWETAGNLLKKRISSKINVVMLDAEVEKIKQFVTKSTGGSKFNIIPIKDDLSHIIRINNALKNKEFVAIHADRVLENTKTMALNFFGKKVNFPYGPFLIAAKFKVPVVVVFAFKETSRHYTLCAKTCDLKDATPEAIGQQYANELEKMVRKYPEQWFNYYNYFEQ